MSTPSYTVLVTLKADSTIREEFLKRQAETKAMFSAQPGFISQTNYVNEAQGKVVCVINWKSQADHEACEKHPGVATKGIALWELVKSGKVAIEIESPYRSQSIEPA